jgi:hypothetical protein
MYTGENEIYRESITKWTSDPTKHLALGIYCNAAKTVVLENFYYNKNKVTS